VKINLPFAVLAAVAWFGLNLGAVQIDIAISDWLPRDGWSWRMLASQHAMTLAWLNNRPLFWALASIMPVIIGAYAALFGGRA
jgi:hypothetical protein